ncbi:alpha/beta fold hydrolase [Streptomonospora sp. PA3]|uniref:alpha/beta fold hydrolase n=1 Tax=Streptomonospora sp. PA3 TaxID=2607326 RepID=UPI0012DF7BB2|nr:alpha/beta fold hydrolase [Streptomonospora sp. PA3]MUL44312.1 alpha/beta fold hydrolase [Streptomonospora sp. PA3]
MTSLNPPHTTAEPGPAVRRGRFWIPGDRVSTDHGTCQRAPMFVYWEAPADSPRPLPLILVHGGGGQGTDWTGTPDGRPGWAARFVEAGFAVYIVDRCGHGRSPFHPDVIGPMGPQFTYEAAQAVFFPETAAAEQTRWTYGGAGSAHVDQLVAAMGPLPADFAESQRLDAERIGRLLDITGPAVVVTHSAGGPVGWLAADARPGAVAAIAAVEPVGPAFAEIPGMGTLSWGLTAAPIAYDPPLAGPAQARAADPATLRIPALAGVPVAVVTGGASHFADFAPEVVAFLTAAGARAEQLHLPDHGITGNGHGLTLEANSDRTITPVLDWITAHEHAQARS